MPTKRTHRGLSVPDLQDAEWAASVYKRHFKVIYYLARTKQIPSVKVGRRVLFDPDLVREHIRRGGGRKVVKELEAASV